MKRRKLLRDELPSVKPGVPDSDRSLAVNRGEARRYDQFQSINRSCLLSHGPLTLLVQHLLDFVRLGGARLLTCLGAISLLCRPDDVECCGDQCTPTIAYL